MQIHRSTSPVGSPAHFSDDLPPLHLNVTADLLIHMIQSHEWNTECGDMISCFCEGNIKVVELWTVVETTNTKGAVEDNGKCGNCLTWSVADLADHTSGGCFASHPPHFHGII